MNRIVVIFFTISLLLTVIQLSADPYWSRTYNTIDQAQQTHVQTTPDNGYVIATNLYEPSSNTRDVFVFKLDSFGSIQWEKSYGGTADEVSNAIETTSDGGYIVAGYTTSYGAGDRDVWILKLDSAGNIDWQNTYG